MTTRRRFLTQATLAGAAGLASTPFSLAHGKTSRAAKPLRVLFLGATGFIGPHFINAALARGHKVSVFIYRPNKDKNLPTLPAGVEPLLGDRDGDLDSIQNRDWDAMFDLATYVPSWVRTLGQALQGRVRHYTFISSIVAYRYPGATDETSTLQAYTGSEEPFTMTKSPPSIAGAGAFKVLGEQEAERQFPGKVVVLRPSTIVGPGEKGGFFTYWVARMERGGEILAAGDPLTQVQYIDVRDLAEWSIRLAEGGNTGVYTVAGPAKPLGWSEMLGGIRANYSAPMSLTWVPLDWLKQQKLSGWSSVLFWPTQAGIPGSTELHNDKATANGLTFRSLHTTVTDTLDWYKRLPVERQRTALVALDKSRALEDSMARERELLAEWHARPRAGA